MFDIFCHKITFIFQDTRVDVNDLIDLGKVVTTPTAREKLVTKLAAILKERQETRDRMSEKTADEKDS